MKKKQAENLFQKFGAHFELGQFYPSYERQQKLVPPDWLVSSIKSDLGLDATNVAICYYCVGDLREARNYAERAVKHFLDYFFGKWREEIPTDLKTLDPEWWRVHAGWVGHFSEAVCWGTSLRDWKSVQHLAEYPSDESKPGGASREDAAACLALACLLRKTPAPDYEHCFAIIQKGKKQKPKLIAAVLRALQEKSATEFQKSLETYLHYFRRSEFKKSSLDKLLCFDGTTLLNIGTRDGLVFRTPPEVENHIIRFG